METFEVGRGAGELRPGTPLLQHGHEFLRSGRRSDSAAVYAAAIPAARDAAFGDGRTVHERDLQRGNDRRIRRAG